MIEEPKSQQNEVLQIFVETLQKMQEQRDRFETSSSASENGDEPNVSRTTIKREKL